MQRLSVVVQRGNAVCVTGTAPSTSSPDNDVALYRSFPIWLLLLSFFDIIISYLFFRFSLGFDIYVRQNNTMKNMKNNEAWQSKPACHSSLVRSAHTSLLVIVNNCGTQYTTEQFRWSSLWSSGQSLQLRCRSVILKKKWECRTPERNGDVRH